MAKSSQNWEAKQPREFYKVKIKNGAISTKAKREIQLPNIVFYSHADSYILAAHRERRDIDICI